MVSPPRGRVSRTLAQSVGGIRISDGDHSVDAERYGRFESVKQDQYDDDDHAKDDDHDGENHGGAQTRYDGQRDFS
jgi:hypothetical protein